ncbi:MAG TPA: ATP synthase F1 subunit delta [bacterium]
MRHAPGALVNRYAKSLFAVALEKGVLKQVRDDLENFSETWQGDPELALLLMNPRLSQDKVRSILMAIADRLKAAELTRHFLSLLLDKDRLDVLYDISKRFNQLWRDHEGEIEVKVVTAIPVSELLQTQIHDVLKSQSGKKPLITWVQEPDILGGIVVQWPHKIFDGSLARKLENLKAFIAQGA